MEPLGPASMKTVVVIGTTDWLPYLLHVTAEANHSDYHMH
jgi:hypothetical protein